MKLYFFALWAIVIALMVYSIESIGLFAANILAVILLVSAAKQVALDRFKVHLTNLRNHSLDLVTKQARKIEELEQRRQG